MNSMTRSSPPSRVYFLLLSLSLLLLSLPASAQGSKKKGDMEQFEELCPYTKGERELEKKLGYDRFGFLPWRRGQDSKSVQETLGGIPMLWVETEHFRIGSTLGTYKIGNDKEQRKRIKAELARLKKKLGKLRAPKKTIDPYLRLHLYAQRAEDIYADFLDDFNIDSASFPASGPHMGHRNKYLLLLCQRKSEYGRYQQAYETAVHPFSYRMGWPGDGMILAVNAESIEEEYEEKDKPFDAMLHCLLANMLASSFVDGFEQNMHKAPAWLVYGLAHVYSRRIDPHWPFFDARRESQINYESTWDWVPRVQGMVKNDFYPSAETMFGWKSYGDLKGRDHLIAWSKLEYLISVAEGDHHKYLSMSCKPLPATSVSPDEQELVKRQRLALDEAFGLSPEGLDEAWAKWVSKTYKKR